VFEPGVGHFPNGSRGLTGPTPYSSWILTGALKNVKVTGSWNLGVDINNTVVTFHDLLPDMISWWEQRSVQLRVDCIVQNGGSNGPDKSCLDKPPDTIPYW